MWPSGDKPNASRATSAVESLRTCSKSRIFLLVSVNCESIYTIKERETKFYNFLYFYLALFGSLVLGEVA